MQNKSQPATTTPEQEGIELHPDSWRRFEETVDKRVGRKSAAHSAGYRRTRQKISGGMRCAFPPYGFCQKCDDEIAIIVSYS
jgi:hypothetical protein